MRHLWLSSVLLAACASSPPRANAPVPTPSPPTSTASASSVEPGPVHDGDTRVEDWQWMRIIVRRRPQAELVATELVVRGGVTLADATTAGSERLALFVAAGGGTERLPKEDFQKRLARMGSTLAARAEPDSSALEAKALRENWAETFDLLTEAFLHPALPRSEIELQRGRQLQAIGQIDENPDLLLADLGRRTLFEGTPYALRVLGTKETVSRFTAEDLKRQLEAMRTRNRLLLVVVGDVDPDQVVARVKAAFGALPGGAPLPAPVARPSFAAARLNSVQRPLPTNYVLAQVPAPLWNEAEFPTALVGTRILSDREFEAIRTKRNLTYAVAARLATRQRLPVADLYVTAVDPPTTWRAMQEEVRRLQDLDVEAERLSGAIAELRTRWLMDGESTDGEAQQLAQAEVLGGDWRLQRRIPDRFPQVTGEQVKAYARRWLKDWQVAVVGDPAKVNLSLFR
jgi:zinc protease